MQYAALALILVISGGLRALGAVGDLWLDELWSLRFALGAENMWDILVGIHHDNNHWLNTIYLWLVGETDRLFLYRGLAVLTGVGTVLVTMAGSMQKGLGSAVTAGTLLGFSYILIHFQSEARGYGPAIFFGVCAFFALERYLKEKRLLFGAAYAASSTLAILSQLTFLWIFAGLAAWSWAAGRLASDTFTPSGGKHPMTEWFGLHLIPGLMVLFLLLFDVRHWTIGGSHPNPTGTALESLTRFGTGVVGPSWLVATIGLALMAIMIGEVLKMMKRSDPRAAFFVVSVFLGPAAFILLLNLPFLYPRYLVVSVPFALLLLAQPLDRLRRRRGGGRAIWATILVLFVILNVSSTWSLMTNGRGQYQAALSYILESSEEAEVMVALSAETPQESIIAFYANRIEGGERLMTVSVDEADVPASWLLVQRMGGAIGPAQTSLPLDGHRFVFQKRFPHSGPSGWTWDIYHLGNR